MNKYKPPKTVQANGSMDTALWARSKRDHGKLVPVRTSVDPRRRNEKNNELYQLKVDVGMLDTVKIYWADVSSVNPSLFFALTKN